MAVQPWRAILLVLGGAGVGIAIAGLPNHRDDPPLRVRTEAVSTTTSVLVTTTTAPLFTTTTTVPSTSTTRRRP
ncbi:MAG: hypothetical protein QOK43_2920 [Acidimicrobiaceae bacterium]|jgi:hypothetical protein|nr:hypothetical protein [Acidimicrobiaceae bacterium]